MYLTGSKSMDIVNKIFENPKLEIESFSLDTTANKGFMSTFKFNQFDKKELAHMINDFQADPAVKKVLWND